MILKRSGKREELCSGEAKHDRDHTDQAATVTSVWRGISRSARCVGDDPEVRAIQVLFCFFLC